MRALELRTLSTPPPPTTAAVSLLGNDLLLHILQSDILGTDSVISPLSAAMSFSSSAASAGSRNAFSPMGAPSPGDAGVERKSGHLREKGSHYRAMTAAAQAAEARTKAQEQMAARKQTRSHFSWTSETQSRPGSFQSEVVQPISTLSHTPRIGSGPVGGSDEVVGMTAADSFGSADTQFMDNVLAQLRLTDSPEIDMESQMMPQRLLPAFGEELTLEASEAVPPPPVHARISALTGIVAAPGLANGTQNAVTMEITMSTQSDQTLVDPGAGSISALNYTKEHFSPLSSASRSTNGHWSRPSDASSMTDASTTSFSSVSSTKSMVQARQLRKELDCELRQMAMDLADLRQRERDAMLYGVSPDCEPRTSGSSLNWNEDMDEFDGDAFEYDDGRMDKAERVASLLAQQPAGGGTASSSERQNSYRWSKSDRQLVARCLSTCLPIVENPSAAPATQRENGTTKPSPAGMPPSSSCIRGWNGVQIGQEPNPNSLLPGIEVDLAYFLDSEDEEDELLRPTYELPVGFLNQPLERGSSRDDEPLTSERAAGERSLHHSRSTPLLFTSDLTLATGAPVASSYLQVHTETHSSGSRPATEFEIMAIAPLQLPARPSSSPKIGQRKSRHNFFHFRDHQSGSTTSVQSRFSSNNTTSSPSSSSALRSVASSSMLRSVVSRGGGAQDERSSILARGPVTSGRPSTPTSQIKATFAAAFNRSPRQPSQQQGTSNRPLPAPPAESPPFNVYPYGQGIAHNAYGTGSGTGMMNNNNKRLPVSPAGVGTGLTRTTALDRLQGLLRRRMMAGTAR
ncbi:unnamed protein product [Tilletia laevis]|uniref:Uncharacterized protein n=4 Tax=Tilletia TaxID=13289 RepID=A0A8X7SZV0_9BASI|nr:hypothetical protein CF335_g3325 [Tilletia laevis]KAE8253623.1 hypothetical protein A4X06_0g1318 [Tilletia controversa]KAE8262958.1 hypothetical protein A4X03_0g2044 [Tilletia caries]CAD6944529.1 unnamed protein product [Tilletia laevis]